MAWLWLLAAVLIAGIFYNPLMHLVIWLLNMHGYLSPIM